MPLNFKRPAFERGLAFPQQFFITIDMPTIDIVFRCVIAEQTQIEKICGARQEFERSKVSFVEWSRIGPNAGNAIFFEKPDDRRPMPTRMTKFNRVTKDQRARCDQCMRCV